jgi:hypothetical protein
MRRGRVLLWRTTIADVIGQRSRLFRRLRSIEGRRLTRISFVGALLAVALVVPATALAAGAHEINVYGSSGGITAKFSSAECSTGKSKESGSRFFHAHSVSTNRNYELYVTVFSFKGFKEEYEISQGPIDPNPAVIFQDTGGTREYGNRFEPPFPSPGFGEIAFRQNGKLLGVGYGPSMYSRDLSDAVFLTGVVRCNYKKKRPKGKA